MNPRIYPTLAGNAGLAALVADRIYPITAPQYVARPYVVFTPVGVSSEQYFNRPESVDYDRVSIDCWADSFPAADAIVKAARKALSGTGYIASAMSDYESDTLLYRSAFDWSLITQF